MLKESSYRSLFNLNGAKNLIFYGYLGRAPYAMLQVGMVIFGNFKTDSYAVGGAMAAGFSISNALIQPVNGRLVDKLGQKKVVSYLLAGFILSSLLITIGEFEKDIIYIILSVMLGITVPNIGAYTRRNWKVILKKKTTRKFKQLNHQ